MRIPRSLWAAKFYTTSHPNQALYCEKLKIMIQGATGEPWAFQSCTARTTLRVSLLRLWRHVVDIVHATRPVVTHMALKSPVGYYSFRILYEADTFSIQFSNCSLTAFSSSINQILILKLILRFIVCFMKCCYSRRPSIPEKNGHDNTNTCTIWCNLVCKSGLIYQIVALKVKKHVASALQD